jgi:hypothetical protein
LPAGLPTYFVVWLILERTWEGGPFLPLSP